MDIINLWQPVDDVELENMHIMKTWLCGCSNGNIDVIKDNILKLDIQAIVDKGYLYNEETNTDIKQYLVSILPYKPSYKLNDGTLDMVAVNLVMMILDYKKVLMKRLESKFNKADTLCTAPTHIHCSYKNVAICNNSLCCKRGKCPFKS